MAGKDACKGNVSDRFTGEKRAREMDEGTEEALGRTAAPAGTYSPISRVEFPNDAGGKLSEWSKVLAQEELYIGRFLTTDRQKMLADHGIKGVLALMQELDGDSRAVACSGVEVLSVPLVLDSEGSAELLRYLCLCISFVERQLKAGGGVLVLSCGSISSAFLAAWFVKHGKERIARHTWDPGAQDQEDQGGNSEMAEHDAQYGTIVSVKDAISWALQIEDMRVNVENCGQATDDGVGSEAHEMPEGLLDQVKDFHCAISLMTGPKTKLDKLPQLSFGPQFEKSIYEGKKCATTRLMRGVDRLEPVSQPNVVCVATARGRGFGILKISHCVDTTFGEIDDELAKVENMETAGELQDVLRKFYPDIVSLDKVRVIYFWLLCMLPEKLQRHEEAIRDALAASRGPMTGHDLAATLGLASKKEVNPGLYKMEKEGTVVRAGMQKARPLWKLVGQESSAQDGIAQEDWNLTCRKADAATQTSVPPGNEEKELS